MTPILTTITPVWNRPEMLRVWLKAVRGASIPEVHHLLLVRDSETIPWESDFKFDSLRAARIGVDPHYSIGHCHDYGARLATTPWIMKLDVDALPHVNFFRSLVPLLSDAMSKQWFNCGMIHVNQTDSKAWLSEDHMPLMEGDYRILMSRRNKYSGGAYALPQSTNFVCRREDYLELGGCDSGFRGWGWEDYQQIYMLEKYQRGEDPLLSENVTLSNVTQLCRDHISRPKAKALWTQVSSLALLHRWHPTSRDPVYKSKENSDNNRQVLFDYIQAARQK